MTDIRDFHDLASYRQWLKHYRLFRDYPLNDIRRAGMTNLGTVETNTNGFDDDLAEWGRALADPTGTELRRIALDVSEHGIDLRQNSPLYGVMSQEDWMQVIKDSRSEQNQLLPSDQSGVGHH